MGIPLFDFLYERKQNNIEEKRIKNLVFGGRANPSEFGTCENRSVKNKGDRIQSFRRVSNCAVDDRTRSSFNNVDLQASFLMIL